MSHGHGRYKRTALTHAVMNGAASVASFLLRKGLDPNGADTSGNANLHYACAYGWYHCAKLLVDAGADVNAANEWRLTPVSVAMLKGHAGIGKFLLDIPGADINVRDDKGRTVIAAMISSLSAEKPITRELVAEIKDMVERRGADATIADDGGKNALHFLCQYDALPPEPEQDSERDPKGRQKDKDDFARKWGDQKEMQGDLLAFLLAKGVSTLAADKDGHMPVAYAFEASYDADHHATTRRKYYGNLTAILTRMEEEAREATSGLTVDKTKPNFMHAFCRNVSLVAIDRERSVYKSLLRIMKRLSPDFADFDTVSGGSSPFLSLCRRYAAIADLEEKHYRGSVAKDVVFADLEWDRSSGCLLGMDRLMEQFRALIFEMERDLKPRLSYKYYTDEEKKKQTEVSVLSPLADCAYEKEGQRAFKAMLGLTSHVDFEDEKGHTPLIRAVVANKNTVAKAWIDAGADLDKQFVSGREVRANQYDDGGGGEDQDVGETVKLMSNPLIAAIGNANLELVRYLISKGADVKSPGPAALDSRGRPHLNYVLFAAVNSSISKRKDKKRAHVLKALVEAGLDGNVVEGFSKRTALHLAVNSSNDSADQG